MKFQEFREMYEKEKVVEIVTSSSQHQPMVSVCVQTYQHENYIRQCLDGILNQKTNFDFEILVGEDNSTDLTREICVEYSQRFPEKIRLFLHHRENQIKVFNGPTSNFNALYNFFSTKGKYVAFCEGDDVWTDPSKLQKQVDFLERNSDFVLSYHSFKAVSETEEFEKENFIQPEQDLASEDLIKLIYHPLLLCTCYRNVVREIPEEMVRVINLDSFLISLLGGYGKGKFLKDIQPAIYRQHSGGIWSRRKKQRKFLSKINTYRQLSHYYKAKGNLELMGFFIENVRNNYKMLALFYLKSGEIISALKATTKLKTLSK